MFTIFFFFFFFKQKTAYEISACLVGSEMCIRDRYGRWSLLSFRCFGPSFSWWLLWKYCSNIPKVTCRYARTGGHATHTGCGKQPHARTSGRHIAIPIRQQAPRRLSIPSASYTFRPKRLGLRHEITALSRFHKLSLIHISEPTRQAEISYAVFCLKKKKKKI